VVPDPAAMPGGYPGAGTLLSSSLTSLGGPVLKELGHTEGAKPRRFWASFPDLSLPGSQEDERQVSRSSHEGRARAAGSGTPASRDHRQPVQSSVRSWWDAQPWGPQSGQCSPTYNFSFRVCSNPLPCHGLLYLCSPRKVSTRKW